MKKLILTLAFTLFFGIIYAQSIEDFLSVPFPTALTANPDGTAVAWVFNDQGKRNVFYAKSPDYKAEKMTAYEGDIGVDIDQLTFSPDGKHLLFVRGNAPNSKGEPANPAQLQEDVSKMIHVVDLKSKKTKKIAKGSYPQFHPKERSFVFLQSGKVYFQSLSLEEDPKQLFTARGNIGQLKWSPDGRMLAFSSTRGDHAFIGLYNLEESRLDYPDPSLDLDGYPVWNKDGSKLAYLRVPNINNKLPFTSLKETYPWSIRVLDLESMKAKEVFKADEGIGSVMVRDLPAVNERLWWTPQGDLIFPWEKNNWMQLYSLNLETKETSNLTPGEGQVEWVDTGFVPNELLVTSNIGDLERRHIWRLDLDNYDLEPLTDMGNIQWSPVRIENGLAFISASYDQPAWPKIIQYGEENRLADDLFPESFPDNLVKPESITIKASDGFESYAHLFLPPGYDPAKKYPAVIFLHGGSRRQMLLGFNYGLYYSHAYAMQQFFASKGYIALSLNYRSGIGYGMEFREEDNYGAGGASEVKDLMAAADYLASRPDVDAGKIMPWGGSYGGYLTAHALAQAPGKFLAGSDIHGVHDWNRTIPTFASWYKPEKFPEMAELAFKSSPMNYVENWKDPVILIHGDDDRNVIFEESVELIEILRNQGVHVEQLVFPDEVHSFLLHKNWVAAYEATYRFFEEQMKKK